MGRPTRRLKLETLADLAREDMRLGAGYGRGDRQNDMDYLVAHTQFQQAASPRVVLSLIFVAQAAQAAYPWTENVPAKFQTPLRAALADLDR